MNKTVKVLAWGFGICLLLVVSLVISFKIGTKGSEKEMAKIKAQAESYVKERFTRPMKVYDSMYDNMGNFSYFDYAAKVYSVNENNLSFLVFYNQDTKQLEDNYVASKWGRDLEKDLFPFVEKEWGKVDHLWVIYDERVGYDYEIDVNKMPAYNTVAAKPLIIIAIPRKKEAKDNERYDKTIAFLKNQLKLQHAGVSFEYIKDGVILEKEGISREF
ncbi:MULTISPECIES: hypothetical protein [Aneurinibacillus]|uniref:Uncharacterized protein n=1 Tax=Aneurinibacillus thermoaerophilus TaxID=143495 RepID=A0A1G7WUK0_ANETH|nr:MULTISPECIES: hypothetical protein [Aneurinibacillus]AMA73949.1 hypothetical protein ACH33_14635 [Aneurinibacillus sp. XH2]MED0676200.1 hypothetical protein [Aneurinibacillus thermoaerophilus]MED0678132.1 hypothetical protein [Aneurinibacillus thermoaerophilus]MED0737682.1 hypothetical protein [Aneurinibacillus thermoaerophilus]MED0755674.1 hypothetical protein [Aneurinibacillus thermoaerophilus]